MTKDEMKNRISLALKDPILQQGFEIICKNLAELKKENTELKGIKDVATLIRANNDTVVTLMQLNNMLVSERQQLTNAKELLNEFMRISKASDEDLEHDYSELIGEAEQFIKDSEVEK